MLTLTGTIRAAQRIGGGRSQKTGEIFPLRSVVQIEGFDSRGLVALYTLTVPDHVPYEDKVGQEVSLPVRAWAPGAQVQLSFEGPR